MTEKSEKPPLFIILPDNKIVNGHIFIDGEKYHHLASVKRVCIGDEVCVSLNSSELYFGSIINITPKKINISVSNREIFNSTAKKTYIAIGLLKGEKMDIVVQKCTEVGIDKIIPLAAKRSVAKWDNKTAKSKLERLNKIALSAAEQSERATVPLINPLTTLKDLLKNIDKQNTSILFFYERHGTNIDDVKKNIPENNNILIIIGPEGGWSEEEVDIINKNNAISVSLGGNILRSETAAIAASFVFSNHHS